MVVYCILHTLCSDLAQPEDGGLAPEGSMVEKTDYKEKVEFTLNIMTVLELLINLANYVDTRFRVLLVVAPS